MSEAPPSPDDSPPAPTAGWESALTMTGVLHLEHPSMRAAFDSPFDYPEQTRILVVNDLERERPHTTAAALASLMQAAGGGVKVEADGEAMRKAAARAARRPRRGAWRPS